ncbi:MAG: patatin family protein, partial [Enterocloster aldenensis]
EKIQQMYDLGRLDGMKALQDTAVFLGLEPAAQG